MEKAEGTGQRCQLGMLGGHVLRAPHTCAAGVPAPAPHACPANAAALGAALSMRPPSRRTCRRWRTAGPPRAQTRPGGPPTPPHAPASRPHGAAAALRACVRRGGWACRAEAVRCGRRPACCELPIPCPQAQGRALCRGRTLGGGGVGQGRHQQLAVGPLRVAAAGGRRGRARGCGREQLVGAQREAWLQPLGAQHGGRSSTAARRSACHHSAAQRAAWQRAKGHTAGCCTVPYRRVMNTWSPRSSTLYSQSCRRGSTVRHSPSGSSAGR